MTLLTIVLILWFNRFLQILSPFCRFVRKKQWKFFSTYFAKRREPPQCLLKGFQNIHFGSTSQTDSRNGRLEWEMMGALGWTCVHQNKKEGRIQETSQLSRFEMGGGGSDRWWEPCPAPGNTSWSVEAHFRSTIILPPMTIISPSAIIPPFKP